MLPAEVATELKEQGAVRPKRVDAITVVFADIVGFTPDTPLPTPEGWSII